jgi:catechol 2,3-dioxygenase-like lactoylglutathione lyase family enzyme
MGIYNHTGHVVTDLARSKRFYQEVLGFRPWYEVTPPDDPTAQLCGLEPPLGLTASYLTLDGFVLELMHYAAPGAVAPFQRRDMNEPGLTHLSISVDDVREVAVKATEYGGEIVEESDIGAALFIRDPDGQLLELLPLAYRNSLQPNRKATQSDAPASASLGPVGGSD